MIESEERQIPSEEALPGRTAAASSNPIFITLMVWGVTSLLRFQAPVGPAPVLFDAYQVGNDLELLEQSWKAVRCAASARPSPTETI